MLEGFVFKMSIIAEKDFGTLIFFRSYSATSIFIWKCIIYKKKKPTNIYCMDYVEIENLLTNCFY